MEILSTAWAIALVVIGLGFVIFIHELGHFLLAKWNKVKVEKFALGFDIGGLKLWSRQVGETEYVLGAIPLGGYVKMLGEEPGSSPGSGPHTEETIKDPRAYHNRPVGARMAIITAGVIMNLIFGLLCFTYVYLKGRPEIPPTIGSVIAGMPAYEAGIQPGDTVVAANGQPIETYTDLQQATIFSGKDDVLRLDLQRPGEQTPVQVEVRPRRQKDQPVPMMGITPTSDLLLSRKQPFLAPAGFGGDAASLSKKFGTGGRVLAVGVEGGASTPVSTYQDYLRVMTEHRDQPVVLTLRDEPEDGPAKPGTEAATRAVTVPPVALVDFGFRLTPGPIVAIRRGSPAESAGLKAGDRIIAVDGNAAYDPMRLPDLVYAAARAGQPVSLEIERGAGGSAQRLTIAIDQPEPVPPWNEVNVSPTEPLDIPGLGLALAVDPKVAGVAPDSPAAQAGLKPGDVLAALKLSRPEPTAGVEAPGPEPRLVFGEAKESGSDVLAAWPAAFWRMQQFPAAPVQLGVVGRSEPLSLTPAPVSGWYATDRGLQFLGLRRDLPPQPLPSALKRAWRDTVSNITSVFYLIRGFFQNRLGKDAVGGLPKIADAAYSAARLGLDTFIQFLGLLSVNLAVINFLPIFPLDGGQFLFLLYEKVTGRPVPERLAGPIQLGGVAFILALMLFVNINDVVGYVARYFGG